MRILFDINHPAHVHVFRNAAAHWSAAGHQVMFTAADKDVVLKLLNAYQLSYQVVSTRKAGGSKITLLKELLFRTGALIRAGREFRADVLLSVGSPTAALASAILRKPHVAFDDTEDSVGQALLYRPFTRLICVPECFGRDFGKKMVRYAGYHELTYLHPNRFRPDITKIAPLSDKTPYSVVRFISWEAAHDSGESGLSAAGKLALMQSLLEGGSVVLSLERYPPVLFKKGEHFSLEEAESRANNERDILNAAMMHHFLAFALLYAGEGVTAASEAAVLGTPSVLINTRKMGYSLEQQNRYQLGYVVDTDRNALQAVNQILSLDEEKRRTLWQGRRAVMLADKIDVTAWMIEQVETLV